MARIQQDQFLDEDDEEEVCPLCVEELDLGDRYFKPCPCGYQICQFCYNNIKTTMNGLCPACRRPYDDKPFSFKNISPEELLQYEKNKAAQQKKKQAAKQKEAQKREADNLSRKHLAGLRVRQRNLVYVTGIKPRISGERLNEALRGKEYFGQYGDIVKIVVSKSKDANLTPNQPVGIYVTFVRKEDAAACIEAINGTNHGADGKIRAQHGTTKYCSAYLRGELCNNRNCMFLHEPGESNESFTRQDLSNMNAMSTQQPSQVAQAGQAPQPQPPPQHTQPIAAAMQDISPESPTDSTGDASALPAGANWANQARRASRTTASSAASPVVTNTAPATSVEFTKAEASSAKSSKDVSSESNISRSSSTAPIKSFKNLYSDEDPDKPFLTLFERATSRNLAFHFNEKMLDVETLNYIKSMPMLWDPEGGLKRRRARERQAEELRKVEEAATAEQDMPKADVDQEPEGRGGSFQLGGEPEGRPERAFGQQTIIQPPGGYPFGQQYGMEADLASLNLRGSTPTQQQQQSRLLLQQLQSGGTPHQTGGHGRQPSRFGLNEPGLKTGATLQYAKGLSSFGLPNQQTSLYPNVQGPPPGLKTTGTPVNGGSMFAQGHGFTSGFRTDAERQWDVRPQRAAQEAGKREYNFPYSQTTPSSSSTPVPGVLGYPYGSQQPGTATFAEPNGTQKQKKKGKKHRHANTSSSGGGVSEGVSDPSILQARPYQNGTPGLGAGQNLYSAGQGQSGLPSMYNSYPSRW